VRLYLDASVLVALVTQDPFTARADAALRPWSPVLVLSDLAAVALARRVRTRGLGGGSGLCGAGCVGGTRDLRPEDRRGRAGVGGRGGGDVGGPGAGLGIAPRERSHARAAGLEDGHMAWPILARGDARGDGVQRAGEGGERQPKEDHPATGRQAGGGEFAEILVEGDQDALPRDCACQDVAIGAAAGVGREGGDVEAGGGQGFGKLLRDVLFAEEAEAHAAEGKTRSAATRSRA